MATEQEIEGIVDDFSEQIAEVADDTERFSQEESAEIYEGIAVSCKMRADAIRQEMTDD